MPLLATVSCGILKLRHDRVCLSNQRAANHSKVGRSDFVRRRYQRFINA